MAPRRRGFPWNKQDWRSLPTELLDLILDYLTPIVDYFAFSEVCIQWRRAVVEKLPRLRSNHYPHRQQLPVLIHPPIDDIGDSCYLFDMIKRRRLRSVKRWPREWSCEGSSHGWLILIDSNSYEVILRDPISGRNIHLPSIQKTIHSGFFGQKQRKIFFSTPMRCVLSVDPDLCNGGGGGDVFVLMMAWREIDIKDKEKGRGRRKFEVKNNIAFFKSGNEDWVYIEELSDAKDIVCKNGLFYVINGRGMLCSCDVNTDDVYKVKRIISTDDDDGEDEDVSISYLVESPEGDLLRIVKKGLSGYAIYKLVWFSKTPRWEKLRSLGDVALFLGNNRSISVVASDYPESRTLIPSGIEVIKVPGCQSNAIYFSEIKYGGMNFRNERGPCLWDLNLGDNICYAGLPPPPLLWISPKYV